MATSRVRRDREGPVHQAILARLSFELPGAIIHHSANELPIGTDAARRAVAKAKRNGMQPGFPDIVVVAPEANVMFFEVKAEGGRESPAQRDLRLRAESMGHRWAVVMSQDDAVAALRQWGIAHRSARNGGLA
jgi:hypothetical protein